VPEYRPKTPGLEPLRDGLDAFNASLSGYSIFGIGVDRKHVLKWLFSKEKATLHALQEVYVYSENALKPPKAALLSAVLKPCPFKICYPVVAAQ
jgi:hypothetical protein